MDTQYNLPELAGANSYACLAFSGRGIISDGSPLWITDQLVALRGMPVVLDEFWATELGNIAATELNEASSVMIAISGGNDYEALKSYLHSFHFGLLLQGTGFNFIKGMMLAGPVKDGKLHVSSVGEMLHFLEPAKVITAGITSNACLRAVRLAEGIDSIYASTPTEDYLRLRKGFGSFIDGLQRNQFFNRLHQFVRAIEAVMKPRRNSLKNDFIARGMAFTGNLAANKEILTDLYELRSAAEHMNPMQDKLLRFDSSERSNVLATRCYQAELLSRFLYRIILDKEELRHFFKSEERIDELWNLSEIDRPAALGSEPMDLELAATENYHSFLAPV